MDSRSWLLNIQI